MPAGFTGIGAWAAAGGVGRGAGLGDRGGVECAAGFVCGRAGLRGGGADGLAGFGRIGAWPAGRGFGLDSGARVMCSSPRGGIGLVRGGVGAGAGLCAGAVLCVGPKL